MSYVRSHSTRDLNDYDQFYGNFRNPIIRRERELAEPDRRARIGMIVRGTIGLPGKWVFAPLYEWRTGFPWSAVNEFQDFVGPRNESGRLPSVSARSTSRSRGRWQVPEVPVHRRASRSTTRSTRGNERDVQTNITSPGLRQRSTIRSSARSDS